MQPAFLLHGSFNTWRPTLQNPLLQDSTDAQILHGFGENRTNPQEEEHSEGFSVIPLVCL